MKGIYKEEFYKKVRDLASKHYTGSWKETWAKYVYPIYPMSYHTFIVILHGGRKNYVKKRL